VSKYASNFETPVDPGLIGWAAEYLNDRLNGLGLGARMVGQRLADATLSPRERAFIDRLAPAFLRLAGEVEDTLYFEGTSRLLGSHSLTDVDVLGDLLELLEQRVALLEVLRRALGQTGVYVGIGRENGVPALTSLSVVASSYGLAWRRLGTVSVIGPVRMDYGSAIDTVHAAAHQLSRFVDDVYDES
jgi:heat-inducible transcriptional repressor